MTNDFDAASLQKTNFSMATARSMAAACKLAYQTDPAALCATLAQWNLNAELLIDIDDTQGFVAANEDVAILAFRGTESVKDWLRNLKIRRIVTPWGKAHRGFYDGAEAVWSTLVKPVLEELADGRRKIWLTGHSLGGALATATAALADGDIDITGCYTFGQPLVGNREFTQNMNRAYQNRFFRVVNNVDVVTRIPPAPLYAHVDRRYHMDEHGEITVEEQTRGTRSAPEQDDEAMDVSEFEAMQAELDGEGAEGDARPRGQLPGRALRGVADHDIEEGYLAKLRATSTA
ncbi:MAG: hypothetical protein AB8G17_16215 [Gammaproteobacteria bacterium]